MKVLLDFGYDILEINDVFSPIKKRTKQIISCMIFILEFKEEINKKLPTSENDELRKELAKCKEKSKHKKNEFEILKLQKEDSKEEYIKNLEFIKNKKQ